MPLEDYYSGDDGFHRFAIACADIWDKCSHKQRLLAAVGGDLDLAMACYYHLGENACDWLSSKVPELEGLTPTECLKSEQERRRLKECLWRMP
jgi:hypothetical protein